MKCEGGRTKLGGKKGADDLASKGARDCAATWGEGKKGTDNLILCIEQGGGVGVWMTQLYGNEGSIIIGSNKGERK